MLQIKAYIQKSKSLSLDVLLKKILKKSKDKVYYIVREWVVKIKPDYIDIDILKDFSSNMDFFFDISNKNYYVEQLDKLEQINKVISQADKICNHYFNLLGSGDIFLGKDIKWNQDFKSDFTWENQFHKKIKIIDLDSNADVKVPWELSRFQHIPVLGQAYWITNDEKYSQEFKKQIKDWIIKNPIEMSVNWTCPMDVAIRACNWIAGIYYFKESQSIDKLFWIEVNRSLYLHGEFIYNNLEKGIINNNHYFSDLVGLIWLGIYFCNFKAIKKSNAPEKWLKFGIQELEIEMEKQVYEDGCDYEASTAYHCLVTELLLYTTILCNKNYIYFSPKFMTRLEKMCEVIMNIIKPNGFIPLIGDMDSGRFIIFTGYGNEEMRDFRYLLGVAGECFDRDDFRYHSSNKLAAIWLVEKIQEFKADEYKLESISYPNGGLHILRNDRVYLIIRCGQNGTAGYGGHTHNDQLSFELNVDGEDFIVDPGTYVYTSDYKMRNMFRSTSYHNTLQITGMEQNTFDEKNLFSLQDETRAKVLAYDEYYFEGCHLGYDSKTGVAHKRSIKLTNNEIIIEDKLNKDIPIKKYLRLHISPFVKVTEANNCIMLSIESLRIKLFTESRYKILDSLYSKGYGQIENTTVIEYEITNKENLIRIEMI
ncbi:alginate lyase family protein [Wukongibacter sp. M2B1]|uniref:alginate lyase family protein n=1 Tax=Wukongibacter sp. M2B1 TaxID=3088895 RepID=UPI003D7B7F2A